MGCPWLPQHSELGLLFRYARVHTHMHRRRQRLAHRESLCTSETHGKHTQHTRGTCEDKQRLVLSRVASPWELSPRSAERSGVLHGGCLLVLHRVQEHRAWHWAYHQLGSKKLMAPSWGLRVPSSFRSPVGLGSAQCLASYPQPHRDCGGVAEPRENVLCPKKGVN